MNHPALTNGGSGANDADILKPMIEDQALMALIKQRYVPFAFIVKRLFRRPTSEAGMVVIKAFNALRPGQERSEAFGVYELDSRFALINDVLHVGGGSFGDGRGVTAIEDVSLDQVKEALSTKSRTVGREFATKRYDPLKLITDQYERVLRECERTLTLREALQRANITEDQWKKIKGWMLRFGLMRDPAYGKPILLDGPLAKEIEQRYLGERLEEVVPRLLREALKSSDLAEGAAPMALETMP